MRAFDYVNANRLEFSKVGPWIWLTTPIGFLACWWMIRRWAPEAEGTGIPQAVFAARHGTGGAEKSLHPMVSQRTLAVKALSLLLGVWVCASTGREGPSVHLSVCAFVGVMMIFRRFTGLSFDFRSAVVAGGSAGLAAAFNTPLAGVTFAIEEMSAGYFDTIKEVVLVAIIFAAVAAKSITGEYRYFGYLAEPAAMPLIGVLTVGVAGGLLGAMFSTAILKGGELFKNLRSGRRPWMVPVGLSALLVVVGVVGGARVFGPGNDVAGSLLGGGWSAPLAVYPVTKCLSTLLTYWSGLAGGIFAPCLSIGSALGADIAWMLGLSTATCAVVGMAAFLSGTIQAPITSFVIIFEMTGDHRMLLPIMLASIVSFMVARLLGARHLYQSLADGYRYLLDHPQPATTPH